MLLSLSYASRALVGAYDAPMLDIARASLRNNARTGVTGALYFDGASFFQVIEGEAAAVDALFATILRDARHTGVRVLDLRQVSRRRFAGWDMKFVDGAARPDLRERFGYDALTHAPPEALARREALMARI
jgi:hypothetical protein